MSKCAAAGLSVTMMAVRELPVKAGERIIVSLSVPKHAHQTGGSLVGVWNGWGYGIALFRALNFHISEPEILQNSLFLRNFEDFPANFGL